MKKNWERGKLADYIQDFIVPQRDKPKFFDGSIPWCRIEDIDGVFLSKSKSGKCVTQEVIREMPLRVFPRNTVIVSCSADLGRCAIVSTPLVTNQTFIGLVPKATLSPLFLYHLMTSKAEELNASATGATIKYLSQNKFKTIDISVPPLPEQQRIVSILDEAFERIATAKANAEKNLHNARALFDSHLNAMFAPHGSRCTEQPLENVCSFSSGGTPSKKNNGYWNGDIPWVSGRDMKSTRLSDAALHISKKAVDESSTRMAPAGALLILVRGMGLAHGAQIAELMIPCAFNQDIRAIHPSNNLIPRYLLFALRVRINTSDNVLSNAAHGTLKINSDELRRVMIPTPSQGHQQSVVAKIDSLFEETQHLESIYQQKLAALDELKKSLLHQAFTGQL
ncbi:MAG: hypothetical protein NPIRA02_17230 [Nitrospirales bacterium]|nr:MAG: hypothetical protein NPIRA02_17230 [Nitrospirales bacterium]